MWNPKALSLPSTFQHPLFESDSYQTQERYVKLCMDKMTERFLGVKINGGLLYAEAWEVVVHPHPFSSCSFGL